MRAELEPTEREWKRLSADWLKLKGTVGSDRGPIHLSAAQTKASDMIRNDLCSQGVGCGSILLARDNKLVQLGRKLETERAETSAVAGTATARGTAAQSEGASTGTAIHMNHRLQRIASDFISEIQHEAVPTQVWPQSMSHLDLGTTLAD